VISPSGVTFYTGNIDEWKGNLMIGCLSGEHINRIVMKDNKVVGEERFWKIRTKDSAMFSMEATEICTLLRTVENCIKFLKNNSFVQINNGF
jgi:hypothetical protein